MFALMKPSSVATRSSTRGTSRGWTVVTRTSGAGGPAGVVLREQPANNTSIGSAPDAAIVKNRFTLSGLDERKQVGVDRVGLGRRHAVRETVVGLQRPILQQLDRQWCGV